MTAPGWFSWPLLAFALAVPAAVTLLLLLAARMIRRGERRELRMRAGELFQLLGGRVAGDVPARALRRAAASTGHDSFWDALEAIAATLRVRERQGLARTLARSGHLARERRVLAGDEPPARRELAARRLGMLPDPRSRRVLRRALVRGPEGVRLAAARALARHRDLRALRWLLEHPGSLERRTLPALVGLLRTFGPAARAMLIAALERGAGEPRFECASLEVLGLARCRSARGSVTARLRSPHLEVRVAAARALGRLGMGEAIPVLVMALADPAWPVRAMAAQALGRLSASPAVDALAACVGDPSWWVRHHAAYALAAIGGEGHDALCDLAARSADDFAREMAREALDYGSGRERA
jgi:HEAT repeat protein